MMYLTCPVVAFTIYNLASVLSVSIPRSQPVPASNVSLLNNLPPATTLDYNPLPAIPGFEARFLFARESTLNIMDIYSTSILMMSTLVSLSWDEPLDYIEFQGKQGDAKLVVSAWPETSSPGLLVKHGVVGLYLAGVKMALSPITRYHLPKLYVTLSLQGRQVGYLKYAPIAPSLGSEVNSTMSLVNAGNSTSALPSRLDDEPRRNVEDGYQILVDPLDKRYTYGYELKGGRVYLGDSFSVFLETMALVGPYPDTDVGDYINAVSASGEVAVNVHQVGSHSEFTWGAIPRLFYLVWSRAIVRELLFVEMDFKWFFEGELIGQGFMMNTTAAQARLASSS